MSILARSFFIGLFIGSAVSYGVFELHTNIAFAQDVAGEVERIKDEIADRNNRLKQIQTETAALQKELQKVGAEKSTLQNAIDQLELERKKIQNDLSYTENRIGTTDLEIKELNIEIDRTEGDIEKNRNAIEEILRRMHEVDNTSLIETLLSDSDFSEFWETVEELEQVREAMGNEVQSLAELTQVLEQKVDGNREKRGELVTLRNEYAGQKKVLEVNKSEKNELLSVTKSKEANYQTLIAQKKAAEEKLLKELRDFESELKFVLDPSTIPSAGSAVFNWPVQPVIVTQKFGGTEFAKQNASVYAGRPYHPGVDFGVPRGTKISVPLSGTVRATGNTDAVSGCYSWGKWTLIDHANGLSTLYAHQDVISVSPGDKLNTGDLVGYTGNTGYSTGPHLHFTVYVQEGVSVRKFNEIKTVTSCGPATTPVAATDAYIDPMLYLPSL